MINNFSKFLVLFSLFGVWSCQNKEVKQEKLSIENNYWQSNFKHQSFSKSQKDSILNCFDKDFNGSVLVYKKGKIFKKALGYQEIQKKHKKQIDDVYQMASVSKTVTAVATMILHQSKQLHIDSMFSKYINSFPYKNVSIRQLLSHRSGLPNYIYYTDSFWKNKLQLMNNKDLFDFFIKCKPKIYTAPGASFSYNNTNYALLPMLIESVSNKTFNQFVIDSIFKPCGMKNTFYYNCPQPEGFHSTVMTGRYEKELYEHSYYLNGILGDKSLFSSIDDMFLFYHALKTNRLIKKELLDMMHEPSYKYNVYGGSYGLGFRLKQINNEKWVYHNGWWKGFWTFFWINIEKDTCLVVLTNNKKSSRFKLLNLLEFMD
ncbi:MAG: serine hydrolase domain-containing protein [Bacteroidota bacterium]|nr:serine hydrolase domain-containing protein [Bacteroidota bacterium]